MIERVFVLHGTSTRREALLWCVPGILLGVAIGMNPMALPSWIFLLFAGLNLGATTALVRRAHASNRSGWIVALTPIPILGLVVTALVLMARARPSEPGRYDHRAGYHVGLVGLLVLTLFIASRAFWTPFWIPSGSMKPALLVGDFVITLPITPKDVSHGDIVVFEHPTRGDNFVKRVIGLPGDSVILSGGVVTVSGQQLTQTRQEDFVEPRGPQGNLGARPRCYPAIAEACHKGQSLETWPNGRAYPVLDLGEGPADNTPAVTVPEGQFYVLGDNRDNATDSRMSRFAGGVGLVPLENLRGQVRWVVFSSAGTALWQIWTWRSDRFLRSIP